jgi:hypothetical protein
MYNHSVDLRRRSCALACAIAAVAAAPAYGDHPAAPAAKATQLARDARAAQAALSRVTRLLDGRGVRTGRELTHALHDLAARLPALRGEERRRGEGLLARPTDGAADPFQDGYAVPEAPPHCSPHFCVHYVSSTADAPSLEDAGGNGVPDYVETMANEFETAHAVENGQLGWRLPVPDGARGGNALTDVYIKQIGNQGLFGYAAADPNQAGAQRHAFLVMDNDYAQAEFPNYAHFLAPLQVTAAHEYNHVLHNAIDANQDFWLFESTAVWMEDRVFDPVNDYLNYIPRWVGLSGVPLTRFNPQNLGDPLNVKVYGDAVWTSWLTARFGNDVIRDAWEGSLNQQPASFAPGAQDGAIRARGGTGFSSEFVQFSAALAEWRTNGAAFDESKEIGFPDVQRVGALTPAAPGLQTSLDHTTFALYDVPLTGQPRVTLSASLPPGVFGGAALVGRVGDEASGSVVLGVQPLPQGGRATIGLDNPGNLTRLTAVLVNADASQSGFDQQVGDWAWNGDGACATATIAPDDTPPTVRLASRARGLPLGANVVLRVSEAMRCVGPDTVRLVDPAGTVVPAQVSYNSLTGRVSLNPVGRLRDSVRYRVLTTGVVDHSGHAVAGPAPVFETVRRKPIFLLSGPTSQRAGDVRRRGLRLTLRSSDRERVRYAVDVRGPGRALAGRRTGALRPRGTVRFRVRLSPAARRALAAGRPVRLAVTARVTDPQRNTARKTRRILVRP